MREVAVGAGVEEQVVDRAGEVGGAGRDAEDRVGGDLQHQLGAEGARAQAAAHQLGDVLLGVVVGAGDAGVERVDVTGERDDVVELGQLREDLAPTVAHAVPLVDVHVEDLIKRVDRQGAEVDDQRHQTELVPPDLPGLRGGLHLAQEPRLLLGAHGVLRLAAGLLVVDAGPQVEGLLDHQVAGADRGVRAELAEVAVGEPALEPGEVDDRRHGVADLLEGAVDVGDIHVPGDLVGVEVELLGGGHQRRLVGAAGVAVDVDVLAGVGRELAELGHQLGLGEHDGARERVLGDQVVGPVAAQVGHDQVHVLAEHEVAVDLDVARERRGRVVLEVLLLEVDRHVLEPGLVGEAAPLGAPLVLATVEVGGVVLVGVVRELVVVPDADHRHGLVHPAQRRVRAVDAVELAVVREARGRVVLLVGALVEDERAGLVGEAGHPARGLLEARVAGGLVDVVAEVEEEVELLGQQAGVAVVVAAVEVLAREDGEAQLGVGVGGRGGAGAADRADVAAVLAAVDEAVVVGGRRLEAADLGLDAAVVHRPGGHQDVRRAVVEVDQGRELGVAGQLERDLGVVLAEVGVLEAGPDDDAVRPRVAGDDRLGEVGRAVLQRPGVLVVAGFAAEAELRRGEGRGDQRGPQEAAAARILF